MPASLETAQAQRPGGGTDGEAAGRRGQAAERGRITLDPWLVRQAAGAEATSPQRPSQADDTPILWPAIVARPEQNSRSRKVRCGKKSCWPVCMRPWLRIGRVRSCGCHAAVRTVVASSTPFSSSFFFFFVSLASYHWLLYSAPPKYLPLCPVHANIGALGR